jgi:hypothetical protein
MAVPETAMHKDDCLPGGKHKIGAPGQTTPVKAEAPTERVQLPAEQQFGSRVFAAYTAHVVPPLFRREHVDHGQVQTAATSVTTTFSIGTTFAAFVPGCSWAAEKTPPAPGAGLRVEFGGPAQFKFGSLRPERWAVAAGEEMRRARASGLFAVLFEAACCKIKATKTLLAAVSALVCAFGCSENTTELQADLLERVVMALDWYDSRQRYVSFAQCAPGIAQWIFGIRNSWM